MEESWPWGTKDFKETHYEEVEEGFMLKGSTMPPASPRVQRTRPLSPNQGCGTCIHDKAE